MLQIPMRLEFDRSATSSGEVRRVSARPKLLQSCAYTVPIDFSTVPNQIRHFDVLADADAHFAAHVATEHVSHFVSGLPVSTSSLSCSP